MTLRDQNMQRLMQEARERLPRNESFARLSSALERLFLAVEQREQEYRAYRYAIDTIKAPHMWLVMFAMWLVAGFIGGFVGGFLRVLL
jgi:hypothetical protein